ncbi:MAG: TetR/AcrR family transcriptional regulator [Candidatus Sericytochromatia bacterium]
MAKHNETRTGLLTEASRLFVQKGYLGFSYQDLALALDLRKASIHYHFPAKEDLGTAVMAHYRTGFQAWCRQLLLQPVAQQFSGYVAFFRALLDQESICPCGMASAEYLALPLEMQHHLTELISEQRATLALLIRNAQAEGLLAIRHDPEVQALLLGTALQGALQIARVQQDPGLFEQVMATAWDNLRR